MEFQCRVIVQRRCTSCCSSVENIPLQAERHSARRQKLFAFPPESAFTFRPECCSESQRNRVRFQSGIAFTFDRIPQLRLNSFSMWTVSSPSWSSEASLLDGPILSLDFGRDRWLNSGHRGPKRLAGDGLAPSKRVSGCLVYEEAYVAS